MVEQLISDFYHSIKAEKLKSVIDRLRDHRPRLVFDKPYDEELIPAIHADPRQELFHPEKIRNEQCADAVVSGLLIWNDCEEESHVLAQGLNTAEGSYFHAIIHRREPDIWNSNYWFKRSGNHPVFRLMFDFVQQNVSEKLGAKLLSNKEWDPELVNTIIGEAQTNGNISDDELTAIQHAELLFLIAHSYRHTIGS